MLLRELIEIEPVPYKWLSNTIAEFNIDNEFYGICVEVIPIASSKRAYKFANISFGPVINIRESISPSNISRALTGKGKPRAVISTVADACIHNRILMACDVLVLAGADQAALRRSNIYLLAYTEISYKIPQFKHIYRPEILNKKTGIKSLLVCISKVKISPEESKIILDQLKEHILKIRDTL